MLLPLALLLTSVPATAWAYRYSGTLDYTDGQSFAREECGADRWIFRLARVRTIDISMASSFDNYLALYKGTAPTSRGLVAGNNDFKGTNARIRRKLRPGTYCIEATSFEDATGKYRLSATTPLRRGTPSTYGLTGTVLDNAAAALGGVKLSFSSPGTTASVPGSVWTDAEGVWHQRGFRRGVSHSVWPELDQYVFRPESRTADTASSGLDFTGTRTFHVSGRVTTSGGDGAEGVTLTFLRAAGDGELPAPVTTDGGGYWSQTGFWDGSTYEVTPAKPDHLFSPEKSSFASSVTIDFTATPLFSVAGRVSRLDGSGLSGAELVFSVVSGGGTAPGTATTDANGYFFQTGFRTGATYRVTPGAAGFVFNPTSRSFSTVAAPLEFGAAAVFSASGRVTSPVGGVVAGVTVSFSRLSGTGPIPVSVLTAADGTWGQSGFREGTSYRVAPSLTGVVFDPLVREFTGAADGLDFILMRYFGISGVVRAPAGAGIGGVSVGFQRLSGSGPLPSAATTGAEGAWSKTGFREGTEYRVTPARPGYLFLPEAQTAVTAGAAFDFTGVAIFQAGGRVIDPSGAGVPGVTVGFLVESGAGAAPAPVITDAGGIWSRGDFWSGTTYRAQPALDGSFFLPSSRGFSAAAANLDFTEIHHHRVSGRVARSDGSGVAGVTVTFSVVTGGGEVPEAVVTGGNGDWSREGFWSGTTYRATPSLGGAFFLPVSRDFDATRDDLDFEEVRLVAASGRVTDAGGNGIGGVEMRFSGLLGKGAVPPSVWTDAQGSWSRDGFWSNTSYAAQPFRNGWWFEPVRREFQGATPDLDFAGEALPVAFTVSGTVRTDVAVGVSGVIIRFQRLSGSGVLPEDVTTGPDGSWRQAGFQEGTTYRVTAALEGYTLTPDHHDFSGAAADLDFAALQPGTDRTYPGSLAPTDNRSVRRDGVYADSWTFTLAAPATVQIDMNSTFDNLLILYRGTAPASGNYLTENDNATGSNARLTRSLSAGTYCLEATSALAFIQGEYKLKSSVPLGISGKPLPDLQGIDFRMAEEVVDEGAPFTVSMLLHNAGGGTAASSRVKLHLVYPGLFSDREYLVGEQTAGSLAPGSTQWLTWDFTMPDLRSGNYYVRLKFSVDSGSAVAEYNEKNTWEVAGIAFMARGSTKADLSLRRDYRSLGQVADEGAPFWTEILVYNAGRGDAGASHVKLYLSTDQDFVAANDYYLGEMAVGPLSSGASRWVRWAYAMPDLGAGTYPVWLLIVLDTRNEVSEESEENLFQTVAPAFYGHDPDGPFVYSGFLSPGDGQSAVRKDRFAEVFVLDLPETQHVGIAMDSPFDNYLVLYDGAVLSSSGKLAENDDQDGTLNARLDLELPPGRYFLEATTYHSYRDDGDGSHSTGNFTLTSDVQLTAYPAAEVWNFKVMPMEADRRPSAGEWECLKTQFRRAANMLYDATDGQVRIGQVVLYDFNNAYRGLDFVFLSERIGAHTHPCPAYVELSYSDDDLWNHHYGTMLHEFGHLKFRGEDEQGRPVCMGLGDEYTVYRFVDDDWRSCNDGGDYVDLCRHCGELSGRAHSLMELQYHPEWERTRERGTSEFCTPAGAGSAHHPINRQGYDDDTSQDTGNDHQSCWETIHAYNPSLRMPDGDPLPGPCSKSNDPDSELSHEPLEADAGVGALVVIEEP
jgi:hypothetical protein